MSLLELDFGTGVDNRDDLDASAKSYFDAIARDLQNLKSQNVRIYRTFHHIGEDAFIISTTSKDVHLQVGVLSLGGLNILCALLKHLFKSGSITEILLFPNKYKEKYGILVTRTMKDHMTWVFHLSPAH